MYKEGHQIFRRKNILENLKAKTLEHVTIEKFLMNLKKEFCREDNETMKVVELKKMEQRSIKMEKFVQDSEKQQEEVNIRKYLW